MPRFPTRRPSPRDGRGLTLRGLWALDVAIIDDDVPLVMGLVALELVLSVSAMPGGRVFCGTNAHRKFE